jgi:signal transduction histidine kinase/ActR/RegA family two-component response regulator
MFAASFEGGATLRALAKLIVPKLAECCVIDIVNDDGDFVPVVVSHLDPAREDKLRQFREGFPMRIDEDGVLPTALRSGTSLVGSNETEEQVVQMARSPEEAEAVRQLGISSYMVVPLRARERTLGCLYLAHPGPKTYRDSEVNLVQALAERAALALDNARLYSDAQQARSTAEAANAAKDRFLAMLSHELRTPLSPVLHAVTLLDGEPDVPANVRDILRTIYRNVQLEARLIDDLLDLARIRNGKLQLHPEIADAHELLRRAAEICRPDIEARELRLETEFTAANPRLWADPARIQQIFWNLITNAIKFTPVGGTIKLATADCGEELCVSVTDTGRGIAPERIGKIFDAFEQVDRHRSTGLGLGLAICKALADLHGGSISAASEGWEKGSTFSVRLPLSAGQPSTRETAPARLESAPAVPLRLLLVEDHSDTAAMLRRLLLRRGYEVRLAESVEEALEAARDYDLDVLVSDIGLPDGTGIDLIRRLSDLKGGLTFRGIALSGFGMTEDLERSRNAGFTEHLTKPVDFAILEKSLARIGHELAQS